MYLQQQLTEHKQKSFASLFKDPARQRKIRKQKEWQLQSFLRYTQTQ